MALRGSAFILYSTALTRFIMPFAAMSMRVCTVPTFLLHKSDRFPQISSTYGRLSDFLHNKVEQTVGAKISTRVCMLACDLMGYHGEDFFENHAKWTTRVTFPLCSASPDFGTKTQE
jgi:hypothetical protein